MTIGDIRKLYESAVMLSAEEGAQLTPTGWGQTVMDNETRIMDEIRVDLVAYYESAKGMDELSRSPHAHLPVGDAVDLLMQDVKGWINADINKLLNWEDKSE